MSKGKHFNRGQGEATLKKLIDKSTNMVKDVETTKKELPPRPRILLVTTHDILYYFI